MLSTMLPFLRTGIWWIRILDFPRLHIAALSLLTLGLLLYYRKRSRVVHAIMFVVVLLCFLYQSYKVYPYTPLAAQQVRWSEKHLSSGMIKLLITNIKMEGRYVAEYVHVVKRADPDVLCILEPDTWWAEQLRELDAMYPYSVKQPQGNYYGMIFYSRLTVAHAQLDFLVDQDVPSIYAAINLTSGEVIDLYCLHPRPPVPDADTYERDAELLIVGKKVRGTNRASIVTGDLNDVSWSYTTRLFQDISGLLDPRRGRGLYNTYDARLPVFRFPIDHVFHTASFRLVRLDLLPRYGSDHLPVLVVLSYEPEVKGEQAPPAPEQSDKQEAERMIEKGQ
jgi:endonuclease/exonuclease/phosphatase (EEP) superfamily protein YafD